jgi:hypothetical protein
MEMDSIPKPINFVVLIQAAVDEGFAQIALNTKVAENVRSRQAVALLQAKKECRKWAKATRNPSRQTLRCVSSMPSSLGFREYTVDSTVVDRVAALELQWSQLNAPPHLTAGKGKTPVHSVGGQQTTEQLPPDTDISEVVIKALSSQASGGPAGPPQQKGSGGGINPPPPPSTGSGVSRGNPDDSSSNYSDDDNNRRPSRDAPAKDWCRYYRRKERKQRAHIRAFLALGQPQ